MDSSMPQRPGEQISFLTRLSFFWTMITRLPRVLNVRPFVIDERVHTVRIMLNVVPCSQF